MQSDIKKWTEKIKELNNGQIKKYHILTMGCQLNENDSEKIAGMLNDSGYEKTDKIEQADLIIFNTCCVRENAEDRLFGKLGEVKKYKEQKGTIIAIGGCMMQEKHITQKLKESYKFVDILFGTHTLEQFPKDLYEAIKENKKIEDIIDIDGMIYEGTPVYREDKIKASVAIMNGCNNFCTYCIVPYVRGRERSRNPQDIINEVSDLAKQGYKEITLLGQNVNSYLVYQKEQGLNVDFKVVLNLENNEGMTNANFENSENIIDAKAENSKGMTNANFENSENVLDTNFENSKNIINAKEENHEHKSEEMIVNSFATLLRALDKIEGIERIRFISPHPKDFTDDVIDAIRDSKHICKLIHLPLQSGSTNILKAMNRKYTKESYLELAKKIREKIPNIAFSTDIIVGFPGETEEDFEDTLDVVKKVNFEQVFMFIYSRRVGTVADKMENQIPEEIKHERFDRLKQLVENQIAIQNKNYVGKEVEILVEGESKNNKNILTGRTESNKIVNFEGTKDLIGKVIKLKIVSEHLWYLKGIYDNM